jgi:hypothetical protein
MVLSVLDENRRVPESRGDPVWGRPPASEATAKSAICGDMSTDQRAKLAITPRDVSTHPIAELIVEAMARGRNAVGIWQDLTDDHGFDARYAVASMASSGAWHVPRSSALGNVPRRRRPRKRVGKTYYRGAGPQIG